jgi:hypothetical protein
MKRRRVCLRAEQCGELLHMRDHDPLPYMRDVCCRHLESSRWLAHPPGRSHWPKSSPIMKIPFAVGSIGMNRKA